MLSMVFRTPICASSKSLLLLLTMGFYYLRPIDSFGLATHRTMTHQCTARSNHGLNMLAKGFGGPKVKTGFAYTGRIQQGTITPANKVGEGILLPNYAIDGVPKDGKGGMNPWEIEPQTAEDIVKMRVAGRIAREVLDEAVRFVKPGITTQQIDDLVHAETLKRNAYPSPLNYHGFPKSCCTSVNEIICHGIPDSTVLQEGDIINVDVTVFHDGVHGDCSETVFVGQVDDRTFDLVKTTYDSWKAAIAICKPGVPYNEIGGVIEDIIAPKGYSTVKEFCGHGIGRIFHSWPNVLHFRNRQRCGVMAVGHTFTIEPMICLGTAQYVTWPDKWTAATRDGQLSAQFEHTLLITEDGVEELTAKLPTSPKYAWEQ